MRTELSFDELPEIPRIWIDFLHSRLSLLPGPRAMHTLLAHADALKEQAMRHEDLYRLLTNARDLCSDRTLENLQRLRQPGSVVVITNFYPGLFGGPAFQILKCLTAIKICGELAQHKLTAVPLCWIHASSFFNFSKWSIQLLDSESEIHDLQLQESEMRDFSPCDLLPSSQISELLSQIVELGRGRFDPEIIEILKTAFSPETTFAQASARLAAALMEEWGMVVLNPYAPEFQSCICEAVEPLRAQAGSIKSLVKRRTAESAEPGDLGQLSDSPLFTCLVQSTILPVLACVIDPYEVYSYVDGQPAFDAFKRIRPIAWPQTSATIMDARSRRTLERYNLDLHQLYSGEKAIISRIMDAMPHEASGKLFNLKQEAEDRIARLKALHSAGNDFGKEAGSAREKIAFQLDRLRESFDAACRRKRETISRQIRRACNSLAPNRRIQERELAGIQLPLRYSRAVLRSLYEKLDILNFRHQLISMD